jgi:membrane protease YdiL (CAAX protease family)
MSDIAEPGGPAAAPVPASGAAPAGYHENPFGPVAAGARVTPVWATPSAQLGMHIVAVVPALFVAVAIAVPLMLASGEPVSTDGAVPPNIELVTLLTAVAIQFPVWVLFVILWARGVERRSLASIGLRGPSPLKKYSIGFAVGVGVAIALALASSLVAPEAAVDFDTFEPGRILQADWLLTMLGVTLLFLMQGASEEVAFRGWMLSSVTLRRGLLAGVIVNVAVFAPLHIQLFRGDAIEVGALALAALLVVTFWGWLGRWGLIGSLIVCGLGLLLVPWSLSAGDLAFGVVGIAAIAGVGTFMSLWAISERSVAGVCGIHGAFNATLVNVGLFVGGATDPDSSPAEVLLNTIKEATALSGEVSVAGAFMQLLLFAALSGLIWRLWLRKR